VGLLMKKTCGFATNVYSRETFEKPKKRFANIEKKVSGVVYA